MSGYRIPGPLEALIPLKLDDELRYRLLKRLEANPEASQRELAGELGLSLGKTHYSLRALIERGWVKVGNFQRSTNKTAYLYKLTPTGIAEKARAARHFLRAKRAEHVRLQAEIEDLRADVEAESAPEYAE